jgi:hypothetical protein
LREASATLPHSTVVTKYLSCRRLYAAIVTSKSVNCQTRSCALFCGVPSAGETNNFLPIEAKKTDLKTVRVRTAKVRHW